MGRALSRSFRSFLVRRDGILLMVAFLMQQVLDVAPDGGQSREGFIEDSPWRAAIQMRVGRLHDWHPRLRLRNSVIPRSG